MQALDAYDNQEFEESLRHFDQIADTSKILFNCGVIYATLGEHEKAVCDRPYFRITRLFLTLPLGRVLSTSCRT